MSIIGVLLIGLVVGAVAKFLMPGKDPGGFLITMALGVVGAMAATSIGQALKLYEPGEAAGFVGAVLGAMLLLAIYRATKRRRM